MSNYSSIYATLVVRKKESIFSPKNLSREVFAGILSYFCSSIINYRVLAIAINGIALAQVFFKVIQQFTVIGFSKYKNSVVAVSIETSPFIVESLKNIYEKMKGESDQAKLATTLIVFAMQAILAGIICAVIRILHIGTIVDYIPYPVRSGVFASVGYFLYIYNFDLAYGESFYWGIFKDYNLVYFFIPHILGIGLFIFTKFVKSPYVQPLFIIIGIVVFHIIRLIGGWSIDEFRDNLWFVQDTPVTPFYEYYQQIRFGLVKWDLIANEIPNILVGVLIGPVLNVCLNAVMLGYMLKRSIDINKEILSHSIGYCLIGCLGGYCSQAGMSMTTLHVSAGGNTWVSSGVVGLILFLMFALHWCLVIIGYLPRPILAAVFVNVGLGIIINTFIEIWYQLTKIEVLLVLVVLICSATLGFVYGVVVGLVLAFVLYIYTTSRSNNVTAETDATTLGSNVIRHLYQSAQLNKLGKHIRVVQLSGFLFFASSYQLTTDILSRVLKKMNIKDESEIILDFTRTNSIDSTAFIAFVELCEKLTSLDVFVGFVVLKQARRERMENMVKRSSAKPDFYKFYFSLDNAISEFEDSVAERFTGFVIQNQIPISPRIEDQKALPKSSTKKVDINWKKQTPLTRLRYLMKMLSNFSEHPICQSILYAISEGYAKYVILETGQVLYRENQLSNGLYFLINGKTSSYIADDLIMSEATTREGINILRVPDKAEYEMNKLWVNKYPGTFIGLMPERGVITLNEETLLADKSTLLLHLDRSSLRTMEEIVPDLVASFYLYDRLVRRRKLKFLKNRIRQSRQEDVLMDTRRGMF